MARARTNDHPRRDQHGGQVRIARLFDGKDESGAWRIDQDRPRIDDLDERSRIGQFLWGGVVIMRATGYDNDVVDPSREYVVPIATHTDGTWIWSAAVRYYLLHHGVAPEPDLIEHIRSCNYVATKPDDTVVRAALTHVRNG